VLAWARENKVDGGIIEMLAIEDVNGDDLTIVFHTVLDVAEVLAASGKKVSIVKIKAFLRKMEALRAK
jgi:hypothetical protein